MRKTNVAALISDIECPAQIDTDTFYKVRGLVDTIKDRLIDIRNDLTPPMMEWNIKVTKMGLLARGIDADICDITARDACADSMELFEGDIARILQHLKLCYIATVGVDNSESYIGNSPQVSFFSVDEIAVILRGDTSATYNVRHTQ